MGTLMAPRLNMARSTIDHSGRFSESSAMRSPGRIPKAAKPRATFWTRSTKDAADIWTHSPSLLWFSASLLACFRVASRHKAGIELAPVEVGLSWDLLLADAAEATSWHLLCELVSGFRSIPPG